MLTLVSSQCDERRPVCLRCKHRRTDCGYGRDDLGILATKHNDATPKIVASSQLLPKLTLSTCGVTAALINQNFGTPVAVAGSNAFPARAFDTQDILTLRHFQDYTARTIGGVAVQEVYHTEVIQLAVQHPCLMHAIISFGAVHIRALTSSSAPSKSELFHWNQTLSTFSKKLAQPIQPDDANALLATATLINGDSFSMIEEGDPEKCWPWINDAQGDELLWLNLQRGIQLVFLQTKDLGRAGAFRSRFGGEEYLKEQSQANEKLANFSSPSAPPVLQSLAALCAVTQKSNPTTNAYFTPLSLLASNVQRQPPESNGDANEIFSYLGFIGFASDAYIALLKARDHRAMLLLCCWYKIVGKLDCWWIARRVRLEWRVITEYLDKFGGVRVRRCLALIKTIGNGAQEAGKGMNVNIKRTRITRGCDRLSSLSDSALARF